MKSNKRRRRRIRRNRILFIWAFITLAIFAAIIVAYRPTPQILDELILEAGSEAPTVESFVPRKYFGSEIVAEKSDSFSMNEVGKYNITLKIQGAYYTSSLYIVDTVSPVVHVEPAVYYLGTEFDKTDLNISVEDQTATEILYVDFPNMTAPGKYKTTVLVVDQGGNEAREEVTITAILDNEAPVIEGVKDFVIVMGDNISYKRGITVSDNYDKDVNLEIDTSKVDVYKPGSYDVIYRATDRAGNQSVIEAKVYVAKSVEDQLTEEMVYAWADDRLEKILTEGMSEYQKAEAIFRWVHDNIAYTDASTGKSWMQGAYNGLIKRSGDCYVYAMTSKVLLTRAGIKNMDIEKVPAKTRHYWNLIDIGEGWYHFDATVRMDHTEFFYVKDEDLLSYSKKNDDSHKYDPTKYPKIQ